MPGSETMPTTAMPLMVGIMAALIARRIGSAEACAGVAPSASQASTSAARATSSERRRSAPSAAAFIALAITMPASGIT